MRRGYAAHWSRAHLGHLIPMRYSMLVCLSESMLSVSERVSRHIHPPTTSAPRADTSRQTRSFPVFSRSMIF